MRERERERERERKKTERGRGPPHHAVLPNVSECLRRFLGFFVCLHCAPRPYNATANVTAHMLGVQPYVHKQLALSNNDGGLSKYYVAGKVNVSPWP